MLAIEKEQEANGEAVDWRLTLLLIKLGAGRCDPRGSQRELELKNFSEFRGAAGRDGGPPSHGAHRAKPSRQTPSGGRLTQLLSLCVLLCFSHDALNSLTFVITLGPLEEEVAQSHQISKAKQRQGRPWSVLGWETSKKCQGCYAEEGNGKPPLNISCLENPYGVAICWLHLDGMFHYHCQKKDMDAMESLAGTLVNERCDSQKNGVSGLLTKRLWKALHLSTPLTLSQYSTGSCPDLMMNRHETAEQKTDRVASRRSQSAMKTHRALGLSLSSDGARQLHDPVSPENLDAQMKQARSGRATSSRASLERASLFCSSESASSSKSIMSTSAQSPSKPKSFFRFSLFSPLMWSNDFALDSSPLSVSDSKKCHPKCLRSGATADPKPEKLPSFSEPVITRVTDCIYVGNLRAAYNGQVLCKNNIDSIIDMSSLPGDCSLSFIPCTCSRGPRHSWSRLKVHIRGYSEEACPSLQQSCFWDINECIEACLEKRKRVLIHCRDGYSLAPTCVIQYLMVKHNMRLLAAYEFVRARYPLRIRESHQDLLVGLERSLWPEEGDVECFKRAMSRKMAWT